MWNATAPRRDGPPTADGRSEVGAASHAASSQGGQGGSAVASSARGGQSARDGHSARGGQSNVASNPPEDGAVDDVFPLNLAMPPIVE